MRTRLARLRYRLRGVPARTRMAAFIAVIAVAGLAWQYHWGQDAAPAPRQSIPEQNSEATAQPDALEGHALGEYQPDPSDVRSPVDMSPAAARITAQRFATNFASPNGNRDDWIARITPDVMPELLDQYRLTDIRNIPQTTVAQVNGPRTAADPAVLTFEVTNHDGSRLEITMEMAITGWKVSSVVPVDSPADPAGPIQQPAPAPPSVTPPAIEAPPATEAPPAVEPPAASTPEPAAPPPGVTSIANATTRFAETRTAAASLNESTPTGVPTP